MKQTAVDWLVDQYINGNYEIEVYEQAKQMEKEQIEEAWIEGGGYSNLSEESDRILAEQYYKETFNTKHHEKTNSS